MGVTALPAPGSWRLDRTAGVIHVALFLREPVAEDERPVAERPTKLVPERPRVGALAEVDHEVGDDGLRPAAAEQVDEEHDGEGRNHDVIRPEGRSVGVPARKPLDSPEGQHAGERQRRRKRRDARPPRGARGAEVSVERRGGDECRQDEREDVVSAIGQNERVDVGGARR